MQSKIFVWVLFVGLLGTLIHSGCEKKITKSKGTIHEGHLNKDETWRAEGNPHIIEGALFVGVDSASVLTIEPGVIIRFKAQAALFIVEHGSLIADGTKEQPILFTSSETSPRPGDWRYILFDTDEPQHSILNHCIIEYGGSPNISIGCRFLTITDCTIRNGKGSGVDVGGVGDSLTFTRNLVSQNGEAGINFSGKVNVVTFTENTISKNGGAGINFSEDVNSLTLAGDTITENIGSGIDFGATINSFVFDSNVVTQNGESGINFGLGSHVNSFIVTGNVITQNGSYPIITFRLENIFKFSKENDFHGNVIDGIRVIDIVSDVSGVLPNLGVPYIMSELYLDSDTGASLTIEPGCILKFDPSLGSPGVDPMRGILAVSLLGHGTLVANGTSEKPIIFTSARTPSKPGDWAGIKFYSSSGNSILNNCVIEYGGRPYEYGWGFANIFILEASPTLTNNIIRNSSGWGIYINSGSPIIVNNTFSNNARGNIGP